MQFGLGVPVLPTSLDVAFRATQLIVTQRPVR